jgi:hypothetical protein
MGGTTSTAGWPSSIFGSSESSLLTMKKTWANDDVRSRRRMLADVFDVGDQIKTVRRIGWLAVQKSHVGYDKKCALAFNKSEPLKAAY